MRKARARRRLNLLNSRRDPPCFTLSSVHLLRGRPTKSRRILSLPYSSVSRILTPPTRRKRALPRLCGSLPAHLLPGSVITFAPAHEKQLTHYACIQVKLDGAVPRSNIPSSTSDTASSTSKPITRPVPQPVSPLTTIRAVRNRLFALESAFPLPAIDYDQSVFPAPPSIAPLRAYENTLNGLLEQLDAIDSDGNEEVRSTRREAVREVEKALDDLERKANKSAPKRQVGKNVEVKGYGVEPEALAATAAQDAVVVKATFVAEGAETTKPFAAEDTSSLDADEIAQVLRDSSEPIAMTKVTPASGPSSDVYVPTLPVAETFLASKPHDQFTFPLKPSYSDSGASSAGVQDDVVLVTNPEEGESVKSGEDGWSQVDA